MSADEAITMSATEREFRLKVHDHKATDETFANIHRSIAVEMAGYGSSNAPEFSVSPHRVTLWLSEEDLSRLHVAFGEQLNRLNAEDQS